MTTPLKSLGLVFFLIIVFIVARLCVFLTDGSLMGLGEGEMSSYYGYESSAVLRASQLPLVRSAMESMTSVYSEVKGRYPLLGLMGNVAEVGVRSVSIEAMKRATPLLQTLEPQIEVANNFALVGLDRLEKNFPFLNQSTDEVVGHLKDALFLTLDDVQMWMMEGLDGTLDQMERLADTAREAVQQLQDTQVGRAATSGMDDMMSRLEDATAYYLPLPPTLRREWEMRIQEYEDNDDDEEPGLWVRLRCLLLNLNMQLYHRLTKIREQLQSAINTLGELAEKAGMGRVLQLVNRLLQFVQSLLIALVYRTEGLKEGTLNGIRKQAAALAELPPVSRALELPVQVQQLLRDMQEIAKLFLQLVINATPLYNMLQQPSAQDVEDFLNQEDFMCESSSRRSSANSLFLKAMDGRPRRRRSLFKSGGRTSVSPDTPSTNRRPSLKESPAAENRRPSLKESPAAENRRSSLKESPAAENRRPSFKESPIAENRRPSFKDSAASSNRRSSSKKDSLEVDSLLVPSESIAYRRPSAAEILLTPLKQFVEYLTPDDTIFTEQDN